MRGVSRRSALLRREERNILCMVNALYAITISIVSIDFVVASFTVIEL